MPARVAPGRLNIAGICFYTLIAKRFGQYLTLFTTNKNRASHQNRTWRERRKKAHAPKAANTAQILEATETRAWGHEKPETCAEATRNTGQQKRKKTCKAALSPFVSLCDLSIESARNVECISTVEGESTLGIMIMSTANQHRGKSR